MKKYQMIRVLKEVHDKLKKIKKETGSSFSFIINKLIERVKE